MEWKGATPESALKSLGTMMPTSKFGELFQYSNLMAAAGGYTGGRRAGVRVLRGGSTPGEHGPASLGTARKGPGHPSVRRGAIRP